MDKHIPERTCAICRKKNEKHNLYRLSKIDDKNYVFDKEQKKQTRAIYVCKTLECLGKLSKHNKYKMDSKDLLEMLSLIKKESKNYLNILQSMKNSGELVFGINLLFENIKDVNFILIATDITEKNKEKIINKAQDLKIPYVIVENKNSLGKVFNKEEINVIGIKDKKMARGLIN